MARDGDSVVVTPFVSLPTKRLPFAVEWDESTPEVSDAAIDILDVPDGSLAAFNRGEFGGGVWWFSRDGRERYRVFEGSPLGFARRGDEVLVVSGLAHLGLRRGSVSHLSLDSHSTRWVVTRSVDLATAAEQFTTGPDGRLFILAIDGLVQYRDGAVTRLVRSNYSSLYPNSMVREPSGSIFAGMRYAVVEFREDDGRYREQWRVPPSCTRLVRTSGAGDCECAHDDSW